MALLPNPFAGFPNIYCPYEDAITNVLSFGGDTDTIGAVTGGIAGAYYGVPESAQTVVMKLNTDATFLEAYKILERCRKGMPGK